MKNKLIISILVIVAAATAILVFTAGNSTSLQNGKKEKSKKENKILYYRNPMDPTIISQYPAKDEMGMDYIPVYENEISASGLVKINPIMVQNMNVKTISVETKKLSSTVISNGILQTNETKEYIVTARVNGYVQKLYANYIGQKVKKGEKLMEVYSPELLSAEQEILTALSYQTAIKNSSLSNAETFEDLLRSAERKLELLEIPQSEVKRLKKTKEVKTYITLYAQNSGTIIEKNIIEGQKIIAGSPLLHISDLSNLWLVGDIYENELSKIEIGSKAKITFNFFPSEEYEGTVSFIYPTINTETRTAKIRIGIDNESGNLKPGMFASVKILSKNLKEFPVVPEDAVIRSGMKNTVILSLGSGTFKPVEVDLGTYSNGFYQILDGISSGDRIVTSALFLINSESNLNTALSQFTSAKDDITINYQEMQMKEDKNVDSSKTESLLIRKGKINLSEIDKNKDGKLYQGLMHHRVISDSTGTCPICGMHLKEFTIEQIKENLKENGIKYEK